MSVTEQVLAALDKKLAAFNAEKTHKLFAKITKVDEEQRLVYGTLVEEALDKDGEVMIYAESKPFFEKWNTTFEKNTDGKSVGNLRAMHNKIAAGVFKAMEYHDAEKRVDVVAKVVDDAEWNKVLEGVYTGFSIGARRVKSWIDKTTKALMWVADPYEGSLVDNPCMYGATFSAVKADGASEERAFAAKNTGAEKSLYSIGCLADMCMSLAYFAYDAEMESQYEGDSSPIPQQAREIAAQLCEMLRAYCDEECQELMSQLAATAAEGKSMKNKSAEPGERPAVVKTAAEPGVREPAAAVPAVAPVVAIDKAKTPKKAELVAALAAITEQINALNEDTPKADGVQNGDVQKLVGEVAELKTKLTAAETQNAEVLKTLEAINTKLVEMSTKPVPAAVKLKTAAVVSKEQDGGEHTTPEDAPKATNKVNDPGVLNVIKGIHAGNATQR